MKYLENNICDFTPLFKINYNTKQNILSACFFKMKNSGYKDFSKYTDGLKKLNDLINKMRLDYKIRLFIDNSIYEDKELFNKITKYNNVQAVLYSCPNYKINDSNHIGLFGTLVRFFPMFNFSNNDANIVVSSDIDGTNIKIITKYLKELKKISIFNDIYLFKSGPLVRSFKYKNNFIYENKLNPYVYALSYINIKKIDKNVLVNYFLNIDSYKNVSYHKLVSNNANTDANNKYNKSFGQFIYGVDEHFLNDILCEYIVDNKLCHAININWGIFDCLYYIISNIENLTQKEIKLIDYIFVYLSNKLSFDVDLKKEYDIKKKFDVIDSIMYSKNPNKAKIYEINKLLYKIFIYLKPNKNYKFIFPDDLYNFFVNKKNFGIYDIDIIKIYDCDCGERDIILEKNKLNDDDIISLEKIYFKHNGILM